MAEQTQFPILEHSIIHRHFTPGNGDVCQVRAQCDLVVVVKWLKRGRERPVIVHRDVFNRDYTEINIDTPEQRELF